MLPDLLCGLVLCWIYYLRIVLLPFYSMIMHCTWFRILASCIWSFMDPQRCGSFVWSSLHYPHNCGEMLDSMKVQVPNTCTMNHCCQDQGTYTDVYTETSSCLHTSCRFPVVGAVLSTHLIHCRLCCINFNWAATAAREGDNFYLLCFQLIGISKILFLNHLALYALWLL